MEDAGKMGRLASIALVLLGSIAVGLAAPIVLTLRPGEIELTPSQLSAAPRDVFTLTEPLSIVGSPSISLDRGTLLHVQHQDARLTSAAAEAELASGRARLVFDGGLLQIRLDGVSQPATASRSSGVASPIEKAVASSNFDTLSLRRTTLIAVLPDGRSEALYDVSGELTRRRKSLTAFKLTGKLRGQSIEVAGTVGHTIDAKATASGGQPLRLQLKSPVLNATIDGLLGRNETHLFEGQVEASAPHLREVARWFGADWPSGPGLNNLSLKGDLEWSPAGMNFTNSRFSIDRNVATGSLLLHTRAERPTFSGTLALPRLNLTDYFDAPPQTASRLVSWWHWLTSGNDTPSLVRGVDADLRISTDAVQFGAFDLGRTAATVSVKNSRLLANLADMRVEDGIASGEIGLDYSGAVPRVSVRGKIDRGDAGRLSQALFGVPVASGIATIYIDINAKGRSTSEMSAAARGKMSIGLQEGSTLNADLRALLAAAQVRDVSDWKVARGSMSLPDKVDLRLLLRQGRIMLEHCVIGDGESRMSGTGYLEPATGKLDLKVRMESQLTPNGKADTLLIDGTISQPRMRSEAALAARQPTP